MKNVDSMQCFAWYFMEVMFRCFNREIINLKETAK